MVELLPTPPLALGKMTLLSSCSFPTGMDPGLSLSPHKLVVTSTLGTEPRAMSQVLRLLLGSRLASLGQGQIILNAETVPGLRIP